MSPKFERIREENALDHPTRGWLYQRIRENPGVTYKELLIFVDVNETTLRYHLDALEEQKLVKRKWGRGGPRFFIYDFKITPEYLLSEVQRRILSIIENFPGSSQAELSKKTGYSLSAVSNNLRELEQLGLARIERHDSRNVVYKAESEGQ